MRTACVGKEKAPSRIDTAMAVARVLYEELGVVAVKPSGRKMLRENFSEFSAYLQKTVTLGVYNTGTVKERKVRSLKNGSFFRQRIFALII